MSNVKYQYCISTRNGLNVHWSIIFESHLVTSNGAHQSYIFKHRFPLIKRKTMLRRSLYFYFSARLWMDTNEINTRIWKPRRLLIIFWSWRFFILFMKLPRISRHRGVGQVRRLGLLRSEREEAGGMNSCTVQSWLELSRLSPRTYCLNEDRRASTRRR